MKEAAKPYRNQRVSRPRHRHQQHLLEVSIRASKAREQRVRRAVGIIFKLIVLAGVVVGLWVGAKEGLQRYFWDNDALFLTDVRVDSDGTLTREQILGTAGVRQRENIFLTDISAARSALDRLPQVERVEIQRTLPNRLDIVITERQPIAWVVSRRDIDPTSSEKAFLADARGYVMKTRKLLPEYYHLPIISGVETENLVAGQKVTTIEMQAALELLRLNADSTRWQVRNVDLSKGYCLTVTDRNRAEVTFGLDDVGSQITRLYRLLDHLQQRQKESNLQQEIRTVNLLVERNTPVTFVEPEAAPEMTEPVPGESAKSPRPGGEASGIIRKPEIKASATPASATSRRSTGASSRSGKAAGTPKRGAADSVRKPFRM